MRVFRGPASEVENTLHTESDYLQCSQQFPIFWILSHQRERKTSFSLYSASINFMYAYYSVYNISIVIHHSFRFSV